MDDDAEKLEQILEWWEQISEGEQVRMWKFFHERQERGQVEPMEEVRKMESWGRRGFV